MAANLRAFKLLSLNSKALVWLDEAEILEPKWNALSSRIAQSVKRHKAYAAMMWMIDSKRIEA